MTATRQDALKNAIGFITQLEATSATLQGLKEGQGLNLVEWGWVQPRIMDLLGAATDLCQAKVYDRTWLAGCSAPFYAAITGLWQRYAGTVDEVDATLKAEFAALMVNAVEVLGLPAETYDYGLLGLTPDLDRIIVDEAILRHLPAKGMSIQGKHNQYESDEVLHQRQTEHLVQRLAEAKALAPLMEVIDTMGLLHASAPAKWQDAALFESAIKMFTNPVALGDAQRSKVETFFRTIWPVVDTHEFSGGSINEFINMAKSGLVPQAEALIVRTLPHFSALYSSNAITLLPAIERYTTLRMAPLIAKIAEAYNNGENDREALQAIMGYQLLTAEPTIQENLLQFSYDGHFKIIAQIVANERHEKFDPTEFKVNETHLNDLLAEFIAQRPNAINQMADDPYLGPIVRTLPCYYVHKLETDLGL
ncbi:hypothetical protein [Pseudomonas sp. S1(2024)]|uniref:hypothetical protein n=1 Tax=Pseudomonas sp. S1(2024) TaxID=3390191 RepID=UPI003978ED16